MLLDIHCPIVCSLCVSKPQEPQKPQISSSDQSQSHQRSKSLHCGQNTIVRPKWDWDQDNLDELARRNIENLLDGISSQNINKTKNNSINCYGSLLVTD